MSVNSNESTAKSAAYGVGVDMISNPISGTSFPEAAAFSGPVTASNTFTATASASFTQLFVSGIFNTGASGYIFLIATSGGAAAGSGASISGMIPQGFVTVVVSGAVGRVPYFN